MITSYILCYVTYLSHNLIINPPNGGYYHLLTRSTVICLLFITIIMVQNGCETILIKNSVENHPFSLYIICQSRFKTLFDCNERDQLFTRRNRNYYYYIINHFHFSIHFSRFVLVGTITEAIARERNINSFSVSNIIFMTQ